MLFMLLACAPDLVLDEAGLETSEAVALYLTNPQSDDNTAMEDALITRIEQARIKSMWPSTTLMPHSQRMPWSTPPSVAWMFVWSPMETASDAEGILILEEAEIHVTAACPAGDRIMHHKFAVIDARWVWTYFDELDNIRLHHEQQQRTVHRQPNAGQSVRRRNGAACWWCFWFRQAALHHRRPSPSGSSSYRHGHSSRHRTTRLQS